MPDCAGPEFCIVLFDHNNAVTFLERRALNESQRLVRRARQQRYWGRVLESPCAFWMRWGCTCCFRAKRPFVRPAQRHASADTYIKAASLLCLRPHPCEG